MWERVCERESVCEREREKARDNVKNGAQRKILSEREGKRSLFIEMHPEERL